MADQVHLELLAFKTALKLAWLDEALETDVRQALDYVHEHLFDDALTVKGLRRACGLSNHNITFRFKTVVGAGIRDYVETMRVEFAKRLLRHPDRSVTEIALAVGFRRPETFTRSFRRASGMTPSEFRRGLASS